MSLMSYLLGVAAALVTIIVVIELLRRRRLRERHAIWWLLGGTLALITGLFPGILDWAAELLGISLPVNLVFFVSIAILVLVCIQHSSELTQAESRNRSLAETTTLLEMRVRALEEKLGDTPDADGDDESGTA